MTDAPHAPNDDPTALWSSDPRLNPQSNALIGYSTFKWPEKAVVHAPDGTVLNITEAVFKF